MSNEYLRKTVYAILASGKNYAYIDAAHRAQAAGFSYKVFDSVALETYMREIACIEANAVVDMAIEIERRLENHG